MWVVNPVHIYSVSQKTGDLINRQAARIGICGHLLLKQRPQGLDQDEANRYQGNNQGQSVQFFSEGSRVVHHAQPGQAPDNHSGHDIVGSAVGMYSQLGFPVAQPL